MKYYLIKNDVKTAYSQAQCWKGKIVKYISSDGMINDAVELLCKADISNSGEWRENILNYIKNKEVGDLLIINRIYLLDITKVYQKICKLASQHSLLKSNLFCLQLKRIKENFERGLYPTYKEFKMMNRMYKVLI